MIDKLMTSFITKRIFLIYVDQLLNVIRLVNLALRAVCICDAANKKFI